jgi:hypothetical protein
MSDWAMSSHPDMSPHAAFERGKLAGAERIPLQSLPAPAEGVRYLLIDALDDALALDGGGS